MTLCSASYGASVLLLVFFPTGVEGPAGAESLFLLISSSFMSARKRSEGACMHVMYVGIVRCRVLIISRIQAGMMRRSYGSDE